MKQKVLYLFAAMMLLLACAENKHSPYKTAALPGLFAVGENRYVQFAQGNLWKRSSTNQWLFAKHQYDIIEASVADSVDLFNWETTKSFTDMNPQEGIWRVLDSLEWQYVIEKRPNAEQLRGQGNINGVNGLILLPDSWAMPKNIRWQAMPNNFSTNKYTISQWTVMEQAGAVFLPCGGMQTSTEHRDVNWQGNYWSASELKEDSQLARIVHFGEVFVIKNNVFKNCLLSIRLVQDVQ